MDPTALHNMPRPALQKLAKEYHIKANLKSDQIIQLLLECNEPSVAPLKSANRASPSSSATATKNNVRASAAPSDNLRNSPQPIDPLPHAGVAVQVENVPYRAPSAETIDIYATPESSISGTPEPEADPRLLERTVEMIADVDRIDKQTMEKITELRTVAVKLHGKAKELRGFVRAERAMRVRMEDYLAYWTRINPKWTYEEVWSGQIRIRNMYEALEISTSDEEDLAPQNINHPGEASSQEAVTLTLPRHSEIGHDESAPSTPHLNVGAEYELGSSNETGMRTDTVQHHKRRREEDPDGDAQDDSRYAPRTRLEGREELTRNPTPSHLCTTGSVDDVKEARTDGATSSKVPAPKVLAQRMRVTRQTAKEIPGL